MPRFSERSLGRLSTAHEDLQKLAKLVIEKMDITVVYGYRNKETQDRLYRQKRSELKYPDSAHNKTPALAVDFVPWLPNTGAQVDNLELLCRMRELFNFYAGQLQIELKPLIIFNDGSGDWAHIELAV